MPAQSSGSLPQATQLGFVQPAHPEDPASLVGSGYQKGSAVKTGGEVELGPNYPDYLVKTRWVADYSLLGELFRQGEDGSLTPVSLVSDPNGRQGMSDLLRTEWNSVKNVPPFTISGPRGSNVMLLFDTLQNLPNLVPLIERAWPSLANELRNQF